MKRTQSFSIDGFKAKQFNVKEDRTGDGATFTIKVKIPHKISKVMVDHSMWYHRHSVMRPCNGLYDFFDRNFRRDCHCEHDCCGCTWTSFLDAKRKGQWVYFKIMSGRNY